MKVLGTMLFQKELLKTLFGKIRYGGLRVLYWDNEENDYGEETPKVKLIFHKPLSTGFNFSDPTMALGEGFMDRAVDYEGKLEDLLLLFYDNAEAFSPAKKVTKVCKKISGLIEMGQDKRNIQHHYDLGNDFFSLWLDETMSYSCAYFKKATDSLQQAQLQKIDHTLKKLNLKPGETLLDIGSGWGWLIIKAAQQYGVKATGITLSEEQYKKTQDRINSLGLTDKVQVELINYLDFDETKYQFNKIVSVGMLEHVGKENICKYLEKVNQLLVPGGLSLLHSITGNEDDVSCNGWITNYIFPGGYVPPLRDIIWQLPEHDFHLLHTESLRMHYAMTLDQWYRNFDNQVENIQKKFDDRFIRMWGLYLQGCAAAFRSTGLDIHQLLFSKGLNNNLPLTYDHISV